MEHESHHHHHPHKTGVRWLDLGLGIAAGVVSLVSLWLGLHSAHSMEKLVASNSYPYVELMRSTSTEYKDGEANKVGRRVRYMLENNGVGPARIEWVQFNFKGQPVANLTELLDKCCSAGPGEARGVDARGGIAGSLIRPGAMVQMFDWSETSTPNPALLALHRQMNDIEWSACYCSVFDDCYVTSSRDDDKPRAVEQCTPPAKTFRPDFPRN
ncbi:hypothetical protein [Massilia sp. Mn16-1_5]|uniref:hypothetical protein n=1 Tax=Massilia sp. Mn16-1_5 TaxID=2079199 RepID=UPI00109E89EC|nr:hypothetical protein [Massilia sp. Mn16-1_5]THC45455.1 hypothetical protein C2862_06690 [Massilia sp. Mn16-1_5]